MSILALMYALFYFFYRNKRYKVIVFNYYGVLVTPLHYGVMKYEWDCGLPKEFLFDILRQNNKDGSPVHQLLNGKITMSQYCKDLNQLALNEAEQSNTMLPENFSIERIVAECIDDLKMNKEIVSVMAKLKRSGYKITIICNSWIDDRNIVNSSISSKIKLYLKGLANYYFESTQIGISGPSKEIYQYVMQQMDVQLHELLLPSKPWSCNENEVVHGQITTKKGIKIHFVEKGSGQVILFLHGFPDFWYGWRYQIPYFTAIGFRAIAIDHRGVGLSSCPPNVEDYSMDLVTEDIIELMDILDIDQAILVGHDIGGDVAWNCCLQYPDRVRAVASLNFPYIPPHPNMNLLTYIKQNPSPLQYYIYFSESGKFEKCLAKDIRVSFQNIYTSTDENDEKALDGREFNLLDMDCSSYKLKLIEGYQRSCFMTKEELDYYVKAFQVTGFTPSLNRFRNAQKCWKWQLKTYGKKIYQPALFIASDKETFLTDSICKRMHDSVPNLTCLRFDCSHWLHSERPQEINEALDKWLQKIDAYDHRSSIFV
ncbi:Bifunctional epoxide hydrolase 2 [Trichoplax sp. H2]|nr:Bifunctional epoxide hydrolase 2 [Trichoplax sp. H2]|eukprot:RDD37961.1 Bifunctional epoxide hydrolase 2 [Trichoplax sp. H2]